MLILVSNPILLEFIVDVLILPHPMPISTMQLLSSEWMLTRITLLKTHGVMLGDKVGMPQLVQLMIVPYLHISIS